LNSSAKADEASSSFGAPGARARMPSIEPVPTRSGRPEETSWSLPQAVLGSQEPLEASAGASCEKPSGSSISRIASGLPDVIW
jgi:hypothetical protein